MIKIRFKSKQITEAHRQKVINEAKELGAVFHSYDPNQNELLLKLPAGINRRKFMDTLAKNN